MVVDVGVLRHYSWESAFIDVPGREIGISEVVHFVRIVQFKIQRLGEGVICSILYGVLSGVTPDDGTFVVSG